jgi:hypothetical protein
MLSAIFWACGHKCLEFLAKDFVKTPVSSLAFFRAIGTMRKPESAYFGVAEYKLSSEILTLIRNLRKLVDYPYCI